MSDELTEESFPDTIDELDAYLESMDDGPEMYEGGAAQKLNKMHEKDYLISIGEHPTIGKLREMVNHYDYQARLSHKRGDRDRFEKYSQLRSKARAKIESMQKEAEHGAKIYSDTAYARKNNYGGSSSDARSDKREFDSKQSCREQSF